jgi:hypothetical protein
MAATLQAHPESISSVDLQIQTDRAKVSLTLQLRDLNRWFPPGEHSDYKSFVMGGLKEQAADLFEFQADGQAVTPTDISVHADKAGCVRVEMFFKIPASTQLLLLRSKNLDKLPSGHQQLLCAQDRRGIAKPGEDAPVVLEQPLNAEQDFAEIQMPDAPGSSAASQPAN